MKINNEGLKKDLTSSHSVIILSLLILILLTGRATFVAINEDAPTKSIFILVSYSMILIFVGFIAGFNMSNIKLSKHNNDMSQTTYYSKQKLDRFSTSEKSIIELLMESDGQCWQSEIVEKSNMNSSKISRTLTNLEKSRIVSRVRDGMGKRVVLNEEELY